jgi:hypothetical protein
MQKPHIAMMVAAAVLCADAAASQANCRRAIDACSFAENPIVADHRD